MKFCWNFKMPKKSREPWTFPGETVEKFSPRAQKLTGSFSSKNREKQKSHIATEWKKEKNDI